MAVKQVPGRVAGIRPGVPGTAPASVAAGRITVPARTRLATLPTPLVAAPRLAEALGTGPLYIKRDDLTGFAFGGNKARQLEFLLAAAIADGADTLVTGGAADSNFCAAAAAAALRAGLRCELVIAGEPRPSGPALALALSWGATVHWTGARERESIDACLPLAAADLTARGHRPYLVPRGGATGLGAAGYALAAFELHGQLAERGVGAALVLVPVGSGGTMAGLVAGHVLLGRPWTLIGGSASRPPEVAGGRVLALARECLAVLAAAGLPDIGPADVVVTDARGPGHGLPSPAATKVAEQAMRTEGLIVDPVYNAKALALAQPPAGGQTVVFWHTGGVLDAVAAAGEAHR